MGAQIHQMTPMLPEQAEDLQDFALEVIQASAALGNRQHPVTLETLRELFRVINSYYSNMIEGHPTNPRDIARATQKDYDSEPVKHNLQMESVAHISVQKSMEKKLRKEPPVSIAGRTFLCDLHREFYRQLPEAFQVLSHPETGRQSRVTPGELRREAVKVGYHEPPPQEDIEAFLQRFAEFYAPERHHGALKLVAAAAAHHRLMWIHSFLDGNGRVARLTEACLCRIPVHGLGLWSVSRGLARKNVEYKDALFRADAPRRNDLDGNGNLSNEGLVSFCRFFLDVCLDQIKYMGDLLRLEQLAERVRQYIELRVSGLIPGPTGGKGLRREAARMLQAVLVEGEAARGAVITASGLKERTGRTLLSQLLGEGLILSDTPKGDVRLGFPIHAAGWFFPDLYPILSR